MNAHDFVRQSPIDGSDTVVEYAKVAFHVASPGAGAELSDDREVTQR
jgi:hypothetical protein